MPTDIPGKPPLFPLRFSTAERDKANDIGLFLSIIGMDIISGTFRFTLNNYNLYAGFDLVIVLSLIHIYNIL